MKRSFTLIIMLIAAAIIIAMERYASTHGALLVMLTFWVGVIEGCIALVAAAAMANSRWIEEIKKPLLSAYPMMLFIIVIFIGCLHFFIENNPGVELHRLIWIIGNLILLLLVYFLAWKFSAECLNDAKKKKIYAVLYLLAFACSMTLVAFSWVMSWEYPWASTLFGMYFFVESFYSGIAVAGIISFFYILKAQTDSLAKLKQTLWDLATLMFGWSILWLGQFYSQYLVIWYGNIPDETSFLIRRTSTSSLRLHAASILICLFFGPFLMLLYRKIKYNHYIILGISLLILIGLFLERLLFIQPNLYINPLVLFIEFLLAAFVFILQMRITT